MAKHETPLLDQLESGPWPSFVSDLKQQAEVRAKNEENIEFQIPEDVVCRLVERIVFRQRPLNDWGR